MRIWRCDKCGNEMHNEFAYIDVEGNVMCMDCYQLLVERQEMEEDWVDGEAGDASDNV